MSVMSMMVLRNMLLLGLVVTIVVQVEAKKLDRPNILFLVTDQERAPPVYEQEELKAYREKYFVGREAIQNNGMSFDNHYITSAACVSSRACLYTGQHLSMHSVDSTDGLGKINGSPLVRWLTPKFIPTMGDYFRASDYDTAYFGKWHISMEDVDIDGVIQQTVYPDGTVNERVKAKYASGNMLNKFGFNNWTGPEPHGTAYENAGTIRDVEYTSQIVDWLTERNASADNTPWLMTANLVNPHDICLMQAAIWALFDKPIDDGTCPEHIQSPPTRNADLSKKPSVYKQYIDSVNRVFNEDLRRLSYSERDEACFYYFLMKEVDAHIAKIYKTLQETRFFENTIVIMTSDHGELLQAHGGGIEKWDQAYEETVHVPLVISNPTLFKDGPQKDTKTLTSHIDIIPTMLGLAGIDEDVVRKKLARTHAQVHKLPGKDFSSVVFGDAQTPDTNEPEFVFFYQRDNVFLGERRSLDPPRNFPLPLRVVMSATAFDSPWATNSIQMVVYRKPEDGKRYKLVKYFDDPLKWSNPYVNHTYIIRDHKTLAEFGPVGTVLFRNESLPTEYELFCLDDDGAEEVNLYKDPQDPLFVELHNVLEHAKAKMLKEPTEPIPRAPHRDIEQEYISPPLFQRLGTYCNVALSMLLGFYLFKLARFVGQKAV